MRAPLLAGALCALALLAGCGGGDGSSRPATPVRLTVASPGDLASVRSGSVEVRGTVRPASATVTVAGSSADVSGGSFRASVDLEPGVNVIDVLASAGDDRPALTAVRVRRLITVAVPDVTGLSPDDAKAALKHAGLGADVQKEGGGLLDELFGGDPAVCATDPEGGSEADAGSTVTVFVSRRC
ncbi:MAG TPA: PASTA domain-containing protein [Baekduia sp.]|nr:PASTA domain-containing protein [Baekduia sp.]